MAHPPKSDHVRRDGIQHPLALAPNGYLAGILGWIAALLMTVGLKACASF